MRTSLRCGLTITVGLASGVLLAIQTVRAGAFGATTSIDAWQTGRDFGTADASARTRASWR